MLDETMLFDVEEINEEYIKSVLNEVCINLREKGYNPINQLVGYLVSGDACYISNYKGSRNLVVKFDRAKILEILVKGYLDK